MKNQMMYKCIPITGEKTNSFVGIKANGNLMEVFYPESLQLSSDEFKKRNEIILLIKSISLAKTKYGESHQIYEAKNVGNTFTVDAYMWILNDYLLNGQYVNVEKEYVNHGRGKINWKRTLKQTPIFNQGNIIYKNFITEIKHQQDSLMTEVYKYCVRVASSAIGWLIGVIYDEEESVPYNKKIYESAIRKELEKTFNDDKRKRLNIMLSIVSEISSEEDFSSVFSYGVKGYNYVYEQMVDKMFGNVREIREYYPNGEWNLKCFEKIFSSSNLRPDTVINVKEGIYILDAKFYRFGTTMVRKDLPNTTSIQKQITYGEFISKVYNPSKVVNTFIMPYNKNNNPFDIQCNMAFMGNATATWKKQDNIYESVFVVLLDTNFLLNNWSKKSDTHRTELIRILDSEIIID